MGDGDPFPVRPSVGGDGDPRVVALDDEAADRVLDALSAGTARAVYVSLRDEPATPPELADRLELTLQNVHYHLSSLREADLVEPAGTAHSEKGVEMTVYAPADRPLVVTTTDTETTSRVRRFLGRILGGLAVLGVLSLAVQWILGAGTGGGEAGVNATATVPDPGPAGGIPPGVLFFAGGAFVLSGIAAWWWIRGRR